MADDPTPDGFDMNETNRAISEAQVLVVGFGWLAERLLVDTRSSETLGPYIRVVQPVRTPQERIRQLRELRPGLGDPESFVFFPWAGRVQAFVDSGLYDRLRDRIAQDETAAADAVEALDQLLALDQSDLRQAILGGEKYHTLYQASDA